ncbi:MAG: hypothetical protein MJ108_06540 [Saccharofermentans sp.]|nr:hypothetical protein [Saccharofermentans sp.]
MQNKTFYSSAQAEYTKELESVRGRNHRLSLLRLLFFVLIIVTLIVGFKLKLGALAYVAPVIMFSVFVMLCVKHGKSQRREVHLVNLIDVSGRYVSRIDGNFRELTDKGEEFEVPGHDYAGDLDAFGNVSLFARFNVSATAWGRDTFARALLGRTRGLTNSQIKARQEAAKEFMAMREMLMEYEATAMEGKSKKMPSALIELSSSGKPFSKVHSISLKLLPVLWLIPVVLFIVGNRFASGSILLVAIFNLIVWFLMGGAYGEMLKAVDGITRQVTSISNLYEILENTEVNSERLKNLIKGGAKDDRKASVGLQALSKACSYARLREQPILALILNSIYPYDVLCGRKFNDWALKYGEELRTSIECLGDIECLMSCACVGIVSKEYAFPEFVDCEMNSPKNAYFEGENITHPLIDPTKVVSNSITLDGTTALITGSNMSGKTTLIRTVGICSVLAYMGAPVPATKVVLGRMRIMSSMRIVDSIEEQMSTFRAELVRIAGIVKAADEKMPMLYLIDEIFRGTNSKDRTDGAMTVLTKLGQPYIIGMMTTHDYALCDMSKTQLANIVYYHFSEKYDDEGISFDYKLQKGISMESNAAFLMRLVGIK